MTGAFRKKKPIPRGNARNGVVIKHHRDTARRVSYRKTKGQSEGGLGGMVAGNALREKVGGNRVPQ